MIINELIKIKINKKNITHYKKLNYDVILGEELEISNKDLSLGSHIYVKVKCDVCDKEKNIMFQKYIKNINKCGFYACSSRCAQDKVKKSNFEKFGVEYYSKTDEFNDRVKQTSLEKYGVEHFTQNEEIKNKVDITNYERYGSKRSTQTEEGKNKYKETCLEKYGVDNAFKSEEIKKKIRQTNLEKYGVEYNSQLKECKEKSKQTKLEKYDNETYNNPKKFKQTCLEKFGVENTFQNEECKEKIKKTNLERYGIENPANLPENKAKSIEGKIKSCKNKLKEQFPNIVNIDYDKSEIEMKCDFGKEHIFTTDIGLFKNRVIHNNILCTICNPCQNNISSEELRLRKFIEENYKGEIICNSKKIINPLELDIYLPELNIAFEYNGLFWHCELNKENDYHYNKSKLCGDKNIKLYYIWEDDWLDKQDIIKSKILCLLNKNEYIISDNIKELKTKETCEFLDKNNMYGKIYTSIRIGLMYNDEIVSVLCVNNRTDGRYEIKRYCDKIYFNIKDSFKILMSYLIDNYDIKEIYYNDNLDFSIHENFIDYGFKVIKIKKPDFKYLLNDTKHHKFRINTTKDEKLYKIYNSGYYYLKLYI